jgi:hypothetical protein
MAKDKPKQDGIQKGSNALGTLIQSEVTREELRRQDFRGRSVTLLGISAGVLTITTGLFTVAGATTNTGLVRDAHALAIVALVALVLSAVSALAINTSTHDYVVDDVGELKFDVTCEWDESDWDRRVADLEIDYLSRLRQSNRKKQWLLNTSIFLQIIGVAVIATSALMRLKN